MDLFSTYHVKWPSESHLETTHYFDPEIEVWNKVWNIFHFPDLTLFHLGF